MRTNVKQIIERVIMQDKKEVRVNNESEMCEESMMTDYEIMKSYAGMW